MPAYGLHRLGGSVKNIRPDYEAPTLSIKLGRIVLRNILVGLAASLAAWRFYGAVDGLSPILLCCGRSR